MNDFRFKEIKHLLNGLTSSITSMYLQDSNLLATDSIFSNNKDSFIMNMDHNQESI